MKSIFSHLRKLDWILVFCVLLLVGSGLLSIWSSSFRDNNFSNFTKQIIFFIIGFFLMIFISFFDWREFRENSYLILGLYLAGILALLGLFFFAQEVRGVKSWYKIGSVSFDPIEFVKIVVIILLAKYFSMRHVEMYRLKHIIFSGIYVFLPTVLVFFQPEFGSASVLVLIWLGILLISGIKLRHFLLLAFCGILILALGWSFLLKDYQKERVIAFAFPELDPQGTSWSQIQSKIAIGSGGFFGQGLFKGSQARYGFLPEPQTDFIFAAIAQEVGFLGVLILFLLFSIIIWRVVRIIFLSRSNFPRLFAAGFIVFIISHILINVGMNLGILPVIGIPLPFLSYGGSSLIAALICLGIIQSIKTH